MIVTGESQNRKQFEVEFTLALAISLAFTYLVCFRKSPDLTTAANVTKKTQLECSYSYIGYNVVKLEIMLHNSRRI